MVMYPVNVRHKGQVTIPASIRAELGLKEGDRLRDCTHLAGRCG